MDLSDIVMRSLPIEPWVEGDNIPWDDPDFSRRMLREHLSQDHGKASRKLDVIDRQVAWISASTNLADGSRVLDLGCGPGLYCTRLAQLGCTCNGIDYSPASIEFATQEAKRAGLDCRFVHGDIRRADFGRDHNLILFLFGEFNSFTREDALSILNSCYDSMTNGGTLILEPKRFEAYEQKITQSWYSSELGLFSDGPHIVLTEASWDKISKIETTRFHVIETKTGEVSRIASSSQAYTHKEYTLLLGDCGFRHVEFHDSLDGESVDEEFCVVVAKK
jgi:SAM-dependent methyltransferase